MEKMIFKNDECIVKKLINGDILGEWQFYRDSKEWINGDQVPCKIYRRSGWACLERADFEAVEAYWDSPLYYLWDEESINGLFSQYKTEGGCFSQVSKPYLEEVEGVEKCLECRGTGHKFTKNISKKFTKDEVW